MNQELPKGYNCAQCGQWHQYPGYILAHWNEKISHKCENCGKEHTIFRGIAK